MHKPPLVERAEALGLSCKPELGRLAHVLASERGRTRTATKVSSAAPWIASGLAPGVPLFVTEPMPGDDPDVHVVQSLESEAPFDLLVVDEPDDETIGLLMPGGLLLAGAVGKHADLAIAQLDGVALAVRVR